MRSNRWWPVWPAWGDGDGESAPDLEELFLRHYGDELDYAGVPDLETVKRPGGSLTGLARMVGLILRLDRARLAVWVRCHRGGDHRLGRFHFLPPTPTRPRSTPHALMMGSNPALAAFRRAGLRPDSPTSE